MSKLQLTPESVAEIVAILDGSGYDRLDIRTHAFCLRVQRETSDDGSTGWTQDWDVSAAEPAKAAEASPTDEALPDGLVAVPAPLPGTYYRAPQPGTPPFVEIGDTVGKDTVVGIIETMKLMNPVYAGSGGKVAAILAENGAMVDGGQTLIHVRPQ